MSDAEITEEIQLFMDVELPYNNDLNIFSGVWRFQTQPHVCSYQLPLDRYIGIGDFFTVNGIKREIYFTEKQFYYHYRTDYYNGDETATNGNGGATYSFTLRRRPILRGIQSLDGHSSPRVFFSATNGSGSTLQCSDNVPGVLSGNGCSGTINYITGAVSLTFTSSIPIGNEILAKYIHYQPGTPFVALFRGDGNMLEIRNVPDRPYVIEVTADIKPSVLVQSMDRLQYNWLFDYIALGSARRIFTRLVDAEMLQRTEQAFDRYKYLIQNRSSKQRAGTQKIKSVYDSSIKNLE